jgi:hypothetical protein
LIETLKVRKAWYNLFQALKENNFHSRLIHPAKLQFEIGGEINIFQDKHKQRQFMTIKQALQDILKGTKHTEKEE